MTWDYIHDRRLAHRGAPSGGVRLAEQVRLPRAGSQPALGRPGAPPGGHYDPPARSWLIGRRKCPLESAARDRKEPRWSAERRAGLRHWPVISGEFFGDRPDREAGHRVRRFRTQRLSALRPPRRGGNNGRRTRRLANNTGGEAWLNQQRADTQPSEGSTRLRSGWVPGQPGNEDSQPLRRQMTTVRARVIRLRTGGFDPFPQRVTSSRM